MTLQRMDDVGIVVESLDAAISFFTALGLELEGRAMIDGEWSGRVTGLHGQRVEIAMLRMRTATAGSNSRAISLRFRSPIIGTPRSTLSATSASFAVDDLDETLVRLGEHGAQVVDEVVQYEDVYRLCYVRGPEGILVGLAEQIG